MKQLLKNSFRRVAMTIAVTLLCISCDDWNEPESVEIHSPELEEKNPALYAAYLQALRDYRMSEHRMTIVKFDNKSSEPVGQAERLTALPDSVDYVILKNPESLSAVTVGEMQDILDKKGIKTLYSVSYDVIDDEYAVYKDEWITEHPESDNGEMKPFDVFLTERLDHYLSLFGKQAFAGINFCYYGVFPLSLEEETRTALEAAQTIFFSRMLDWIEKHPDKEVFFEGVPFNMLYDVKILEKCRFIIISGLDASNKNELSYAVRIALTDGCPADRIVIGVSAPSIFDPTKDTRLFAGTYADGSRIRAIDAASEWVVVPSEGFLKAGICVEEAQNDYYESQIDYKYIRKAIGTMNPSPIN